MSQIVAKEGKSRYYVNSATTLYMMNVTHCIVNIFI